MGRPSKLTEAQWGEVLRFAAGGESLGSLAARFKVSKGAVSKRVSKRLDTVKTLAGTIANAEMEFEVLPVSQQVAVRGLADQLKGISNNLAEAALLGSGTAKALAKRANDKLQALDDTDPEVAAAALKSIAALHITGNEASKTAMGLVNANKGKDDSRASTLEDLIVGASA